MLGAGPFITIPLLLGAMGGPQGMIGWVVAMIIVMCDGLIWAELGAAFPGSGGTYHYLREIFKGSEWGRFLPVLVHLAVSCQRHAGGCLGLHRRVGVSDDAVARVRRDGAAMGLAEERRSSGLPASVMVAVIFLALCQRIRSIGWLEHVPGRGCADGRRHGDRVGRSSTSTPR